MATFIELKYWTRESKENNVFHIYKKDIEKPYIYYFNIDLIERVSPVFKKPLIIKNDDGKTTSDTLEYFILYTFAEYYILPSSEFSKLISNNKEISL